MAQIKLSSAAQVVQKNLVDNPAVAKRINAELAKLVAETPDSPPKNRFRRGTRTHEEHENDRYFCSRRRYRHCL